MALSKLKSIFPSLTKLQDIVALLDQAHDHEACAKCRDKMRKIDAEMQRLIWCGLSQYESAVRDSRFAYWDPDKRTTRWLDIEEEVMRPDLFNFSWRLNMALIARHIFMQVFPKPLFMLHGTRYGKMVNGPKRKDEHDRPNSAEWEYKFPDVESVSRADRE